MSAYRSREGLDIGPNPGSGIFRLEEVPRLKPYKISCCFLEYPISRKKSKFIHDKM